MRLAPAALVAVIAFGAPARGDDSFEAQANLHLRTTTVRNEPSSAVLYDRQLGTFDVRPYLVPEGEDRYGSLYASLRLAGSFRGGDLRWVVLADTGEVRRRAFPLVAQVCAADTPTGLTVWPGAPMHRCISAPVPLEETRYAAPIAVMNGRSVDEELRHTLLVREAYLAWSFGKAGFATLRAGRKRTTIGDGLVHDDYATGVELGLDLGALGPSWAMGVGVFQPTRDFPSTVRGISPVAVARVDYLPSLFERAGIFVAALRDRSGSVGEIVRGAVIEQRVGALDQAIGTAAEPTFARDLARTLDAPLESDASLGWAGTSGSLAPWRGTKLGWTLALQGGTLHRLTTTGPLGAQVDLARDVPLRGGVASARLDVDLGEKVTVAPSFLYLSGAPPPSPGQPYRSFIGIVPYVTTTNLFFNGGLSETFSARQATAAGVNGRGVVAPTLAITYDPWEKVTVQGKAAYLRSAVPGPFGGSTYGTEADLTATWMPRPWLMVGIEADALWTDDFYAARATITKTLLAVDFLTP
ncbi:MAG TPA: hypothetical protein VF875_18470 [Anaeromyxobacter sp.]